MSTAAKAGSRNDAAVAVASAEGEWRHPISRHVADDRHLPLKSVRRPRALDLPHPGLYARAWKHAIHGGIVRWNRHQEDGVEKFQRALHARINVRGGLPVTLAAWRKLEPDWFWWVWRLARTINGTRIIVRPGEVPRELRDRLRNRITWPGEE